MVRTLHSTVNEEKTEVCSPIRFAELDDIKSIVELWANIAALRQFYDPARWSWKTRASQIWSQYAHDIITSPRAFMLICDRQDHGLSGFLTAYLQERPAYYITPYELVIDEMYLRPKDRHVKIFRQMIDELTREACLRESMKDPHNLSLRIDCLEKDRDIAEMLIEAGFKPSAVTYTAQLAD
ncbi:MAG: hypothetical protein SFT81_07380 [Candidatus Caenarcaniphilales bacterium]|nr:hypothetical protein [Candidatus Caenarcaniphilales bacterium]